MQSLRQELNKLFSAKDPLDLSPQFQLRACVGVLLRGEKLSQLEVAYIRRSVTTGDRWSGQVAFPGGKQEATDADDLATAAREVKEEVGIELDRNDCIGRLGDIQIRSQASPLEFFVRPFVFFLERPVSVTLDLREVSSFFWVPLSQLTSSESQTHHEWVHAGQSLRLPAIRVEGDPPLWGMTYFMTRDLVETLETSSQTS